MAALLNTLQPPICLAARNGDLEEVKKLSSGADAVSINTHDKRGYSVLMCALENPTAVEIVRQLVLELKADVNFTTVRG
jgi:hypothetical protein